MKIKIFKTEIIIRRNDSRKPKTWARKGRCPGCGVSTGSKHSKDCDYFYLPVKSNKR